MNSEVDIVGQLRRALRTGLLNGRISGNEIAAQLGMHRRTLHRRLSARGVTFQQIQDEIRCEFAKQLLTDTQLGIGNIGLIIHYTDPSVFTRAFVRWAGVSPSEYRQRSRLNQSLL